MDPSTGLIQGRVWAVVSSLAAWCQPIGFMEVAGGKRNLVITRGKYSKIVVILCFCAEEMNMSQKLICM